MKQLQKQIIVKCLPSFDEEQGWNMFQERLSESLGQLSTNKIQVMQSLIEPLDKLDEKAAIRILNEAKKTYTIGDLMSTHGVNGKNSAARQASHVLNQSHASGTTSSNLSSSSNK
jgi:hypothetical protein